MQQVPAQVGLDLVERRVGNQRVELGHELRLCVVRFAGRRGVGGGNVVGQREMRQFFCEAGNIGGMVEILADRAAR